MTDLEVPKKPGRPPKNEATRTGWRPSNQLATLKAPSGFTARWVHSDPARIAKLKAEGWRLMKHEDNEGEYLHEDVTTGQSLGTEIRYRDHIAMMIPDDVKKARTEYYSKETQEALRAVTKKSDSEIGATGAQVYTPKGREGRIVIE